MRFAFGDRVPFGDVVLDRGAYHAFAFPGFVLAAALAFARAFKSLDEFR
ncbi:hypothetical protein [Nocardia cyriacigeorgica]|nr:hypothetical protein [Nocardia cyriacigeorgica]